MLEPYPKHYLADVPQELRLKLLDLCILRRYDEAYELLQASGFTHYERHELVWFHDWAPTNLDPDRLRPTPPASTQQSPSCESPSTPLILQVVGMSGGLTQPEALTIEESNLNLNGHHPDPNLSGANLNPSPAAVKLRKPRSKISHLPSEIQNSLNALLQRGHSYSDLVAWLNAQGYRGFNKVNIHNWRRRRAASEVVAPTT